MTIIAIDGMGGDLGLEAVIPGLRKAFDDIGDKNLKFKVFAKRDKALDLITKYNMTDHIILHDVDHVLSEDDHHIKVIQKGATSSLGRAIMAVAEKRAQAVVSSGSTAAFLLLCHQYLKKIPVINKIALQATMPTLKSEVIMLDLGATLSVTDEDLVQFAHMGHVLAQNLCDLKKPSIGLLNVGKEEIKGLPYLIKAHRTLKETDFINYKGFVEGNDIFSGNVDVVVTDGFSGNLVLKAIEGTSVLIKNAIKESLKKSFIKRFFALGLSGSLVSQRLDRRQYNGAVLLGLSSLAIKSHGNSDPVGFSAAVKVAYKLITKDFIANFEKHMTKATPECIKQKS